MRKISYAVALVCSVSPVFAADLILDDVPTVSAAKSIAGYIEASGAYEIGEYGGDPGEYTSKLYQFGGAGRVAIPMSDVLALQLDAWAVRDNFRFDDEDPDYYMHTFGGAAHLAYALDDSAKIGTMVSVGARQDFYEDTWATGAVEGAVAFDSMRLYGQAGASFNLDEDYAYGDVVVAYVQGVLAYYIDPNLKVSASAGVSKEYEDSRDRDVMLVKWGAKLETKLEDSPISLFAAYEGQSWDGTDAVDGDWDGSTHAIKVGARFAFGDGTSTLQDLDNNVGLKDMNHVYGQHN
jgi:hypothetical protein